MAVLSNLVIYWLCIPVIATQSVFNSGEIPPTVPHNVLLLVENLGKLVSLERLLVTELTDQADQLRGALDNIEEYLSEVREVYSHCGQDGCNERDTEAIIGNPIHNFQLLKRVTVFWKNVQSSIERADGKKTLSKLRKLRKKVVHLPTDVDLERSARSLTNLLEVYKLEAGEVAVGVLDNVRTGARLAVEDIYYLASQAAGAGQHQVSASLLREGLTRIQQNHTDNQMKISMENLLFSQEQRGKQTETGEKTRYVLGKIPPKTHDFSKMTTREDRVNYDALCRGEDLLDPALRRSLFCFFSSRSDPYFILHPIAVEEVHPEPHQVLVLHHVLSDRETEGVARLAGHLMRQSGIGQEKTLSTLRQSESCWVEDGVSPLVDRLSLRMNWITGLHTSALHDPEAKKEEYEYLQLGSYGTGGYYRVHQDPLFVYKDNQYIAQSVEAVGREQYPTGDRMSTLMFYLSRVEAGGRTVFPRLGVGLPPSPGSAVLWHNIQRDGWSDMAMLHGGCPVILGRKVVANKWIREVANIQTRRCGLGPDEHQYTMY